MNRLPSAHQPDNPPVTVDILQRVKPGCENAFEAVLSDLIAAAGTFEGHLGVNVFRSGGDSNDEYRIVFKFASLGHLKQWETSAIRQQLLRQANRLTIDQGKTSILTGLETWFTLPTQSRLSPPARHKMVVISGAAIFILLNLANVLLVPLLAFLPALLRTFVVVLLIVVLMTYLVMPRLTKLFADWLYPKAKR